VASTELKQKMNRVGEYLSGVPEISMAFLFGSHSREEATSESDVDIGVYFQPEGKELEWEETRVHENEDLIWTNVEKILGLRTDLVVLNRAASSLAAEVLRNGDPLLIKDHGLYIRLLLSVTDAAAEFHDFTQDFWKIKQRSRSLNPSDKDRLVRTSDFLETELRDWPQFKGIGQREYETDSSKRRNVERWIENIVNSSIDMAKILLASHKQRMPQTYREVLLELSCIDEFEEAIAEKLSGFAKLRNILAHEYLDVRYKHIHRFIEEAHGPYEDLLCFVKKAIEKG